LFQFGSQITVSGYIHESLKEASLLALHRAGIAEVTDQPITRIAGPFSRWNEFYLGQLNGKCDSINRGDSNPRSVP